jgi:hypothetical protein
MKSAGPRHSHQASKWSPFSIDRYDRNPALTSTEARALKSHVHEHHPAKPTLHDKVIRLINPLEDLFNHTKLRHAIRPFLVLYMLREINRRGASATASDRRRIPSLWVHRPRHSWMGPSFIYQACPEGIWAGLRGRGARSRPHSSRRVGLFRKSRDAPHTADGVRGLIGQS